MLYFRVKRETKAWELFHQLWTQEDKWDANRERIEALIGCPMSKNLALYVRELCLSQPPDHLQSQFKINSDRGGFFAAKKNSPIRKAWLELVQEVGMTDLTISKLVMELGLWPGDNRSLKQSYPPINGEYYFSAKPEDPEKAERRKDSLWADTDWAEPINEPHFLRLRADWLEAKVKEDVNATVDSEVEGSQTGQ